MRLQGCGDFVANLGAGGDFSDLKYAGDKSSNQITGSMELS